MIPESDFRKTTQPSPRDQEDESLRKLVALLNAMPPAIAAAYVDGSGQILTDATSQSVFSANAKRRYLLFQNVSDTDMWVGIGADAVAGRPSVKVEPGGYFEPYVPPSQALYVLCATAGKEFTAYEA